MLILIYILYIERNNKNKKIFTTFYGELYFQLGQKMLSIITGINCPA